MSAFLAQDELKTLTGYARKACQVAQLRKMGIAYFLNAAGHPVVPRSIFDPKLATPVQAEWEPSVLKGNSNHGKAQKPLYESANPHEGAGSWG
jgi:hypothetical protein